MGKASRIIVMKGRKINSFDMRKDPPGKDDLQAMMLGTSGNLRAPLIVRGKTVLVGFNQDVFDEVLG